MSHNPLRDSRAYKNFVKRVKRRDGHKCQMPGCESKIKLEVHHIKTVLEHEHLVLEDDNGITLCRICHDSITNKEDSYVATFQGIVEAKKAVHRQNHAQVLSLKYAHLLK